MTSEVASSKDPEGDLEEEEDEEESNRRAEGANEEDEGDNAGQRSASVRNCPPRAPRGVQHGGFGAWEFGDEAVDVLYSRPHGQVNGESAVELVGVGAVCGDDLKLGDVDAAERKPEGTVRGEGSGTKGVTAGPLLDTGDDLSETTVAEGETKNDVGVGNVTDLEVVERENEGGAAETVRQSSETRIAPLASTVLTREDQEGRGWQTCLGWC